MPDDNIRFPEDLFREVIHVSFVIDDLLDTGVYEVDESNVGIYKNRI